MLNLTKQKRVRLKGAAIVKLNLAIHERDNYTCIINGCGGYVSIDEKWHHEPCGQNKEDVIEKGCLLCYKHHIQRDSKDGAPIKQACEEYLDRRYPERR